MPLLPPPSLLLLLFPCGARNLMMDSASTRLARAIWWMHPTGDWQTFDDATSIKSLQLASLPAQESRLCRVYMLALTNDAFLTADERVNWTLSSPNTNMVNLSFRVTPTQITGPFQHYWYRQTLNISDDVNHWTSFNWPVFVALCIAWLISHVCLARGLSSSKRIVYFTFTLPYVILTVFFFKATSLKGMSDGIYYLFEPEVSFENISWK